MINDVFAYESTRRRQLAAPFLQERESYLTHIISQGTSKARVKVVASMLLHVVRFMEIESLRVVNKDDIELGCQRWLADPETHKRVKIGTQSGAGFTRIAIKWLSFHDLLSEPSLPTTPAQSITETFVNFVEVNRGSSISTIRVFRSRLNHFLDWALVRRAELSLITIEDVEEFLEIKRSEGCLPRTIQSYCTALRTFFRFAEVQGWTTAKIARCIHGPRISRFSRIPKGPQWKEIRKLINERSDTSHTELRSRAILLLCSIYALRSSEVTNLTLEDFDWLNETFTIRRSKRGRVQQFPIQHEVGDAILRYLQGARPRCSCRNLFVTLKPPFRPMLPATLWTVVARRIDRLGLDIQKFGPHALRHVSATRLLHKGCSLQEIADFLGHRRLTSVSIYARHDVHSLQQVAAFSLAGVK